MKTTYISLVMILMLSSAFAQQMAPSATRNDIYKHYTGTIGSKRVVLDMRYGYNGGSNYGGSTYYSPGENTTTRFFIRNPGSSYTGVPMTATEEPQDDTLYEDYGASDEARPTWNFTITANKLIGKWHSADYKEHADIDLTEDYSRSMPLTLRVYDDTAYRIMSEARGTARSFNLIYVIPAPLVSPAAKSLIHDGMMQLSAGIDPQISEWSEYEEAHGRQFLAEYEKIKTKHLLDDPGSMYFLKGIEILPVYNDNGLLVLEKEEDVWGSEGLKKNVVTHLCIDVQNNSFLLPEDMLVMNKRKLSGLLETEARRRFKIDPRKKLSTSFVSDTIPVTNDIYPVHDGIFFSYAPGELAKEIVPAPALPYKKRIDLYLSYQQLGSLLYPDFKKRIGM